jgi:hypothetical protein
MNPQSSALRLRQRPATRSNASERCGPRSPNGTTSRPASSSWSNQAGVDVDRRDPAVLTDDLRQQRRVVTRTRADLQDSLAGREVELLQHQGHDGRLGRGADRHAVAVGLGDDRMIAVRLVEGDLGHEQMARHRSQCRLDGWIGNRAIPRQLVDHRGAQRIGGHVMSLARTARIRA